MFSKKVQSFGGYYLVGIGGISMSALARLLHARRIPVRGSDKTESTVTRALQAEGISVHIGEEEEITEDTVVYTGAVSERQTQLKRAKEAGKRLFTRAQFLGEIAGGYPHVIAVSGCHGKTSCTAMLAHIFHAGRKPFTCHIGGEDCTFGNYARFGDKFLITEACEYQKSFLCIPSECAVVLNIDRDHMDCYRDERDLYEAFAEFASRAKYQVVSGENTRARSIAHTHSFGISAGDYRAENLRAVGEKYSFTVTERGRYLAEISLNVEGKVYVYNALAAIAVARCYGLSPDAIRRGLKRFCGVKRRFERVGRLQGAQVVCDYAHHPRELLASIRTAKAICKGRVQVLFQPHTYSRTKDLMDEFIHALKEADAPLLFPTYAAREAYDGEGSAVALAAKLPTAGYVRTLAQLKTRLDGALCENDMLLVLGAGDLYEQMKELLD